MKLSSIELARIAIPFRVPFRHAAAEHRQTDSVWVEAHTRGGAIGCGEACPRAYVTGETVGSAAAFFARHRSALIEQVSDRISLLAWCDAHRAEIDRYPAAWCAIEMALLDALAKEEGQCVESFLGLPPADRAFRYSAVVGVGDGAAFRATVEQYRALRFDDFKVKVSGDARLDRENLAWFRTLAGGECRLRLDANNLWRTFGDAAGYLDRLSCPIFALEEPLPAGQYRALARLAASRGVPIILDESCVRAEQLCDLDALGGAWIVNVRVSKMGGVLRSLRAVDAARRRGLPIIVGAQVGETSLLTRAALTVAGYAGDSLIAQEGAFGTWLLATDVCDAPLMFGPAGTLALERPLAPGFGIDVKADRSFLRHS